MYSEIKIKSGGLMYYEKGTNNKIWITQPNMIEVKDKLKESLEAWYLINLEYFMKMVPFGVTGIIKLRFEGYGCNPKLFLECGGFSYSFVNELLFCITYDQWSWNYSSNCYTYYMSSNYELVSQLTSGNQGFGNVDAQGFEIVLGGAELKYSNDEKIEIPSFIQQFDWVSWAKTEQLKLNSYEKGKELHFYDKIGDKNIFNGKKAVVLGGTLGFVVNGSKYTLKDILSGTVTSAQLGKTWAEGMAKCSGLMYMINGFWTGLSWATIGGIMLVTGAAWLGIKSMLNPDSTGWGNNPMGQDWVGHVPQGYAPGAPTGTGTDYSDGWVYTKPPEADYTAENAPWIPPVTGGTVNTGTGGVTTGGVSVPTTGVNGEIKVTGIPSELQLVLSQAIANGIPLTAENIQSLQLTMDAELAQKKFELLPPLIPPDLLQLKLSNELSTYEIPVTAPDMTGKNVGVNWGVPPSVSVTGDIIATLDTTGAKVSIAEGAKVGFDVESLTGINAISEAMIAHEAVRQGQELERLERERLKEERDIAAHDIDYKNEDAVQKNAKVINQLKKEAMKQSIEGLNYVERIALEHVTDFSQAEYTQDGITLKKGLKANAEVSHAESLNNAVLGDAKIKSMINLGNKAKEIDLGEEKVVKKFKHVNPEHRVDFAGIISKIFIPNEVV